MCRRFDPGPNHFAICREIRCSTAVIGTLAITSRISAFTSSIASRAARTPFLPVSVPTAALSADKFWGPIIAGSTAAVAALIIVTLRAVNRMSLTCCIGSLQRCTCAAPRAVAVFRANPSCCGETYFSQNGVGSRKR